MLDNLTTGEKVIAGATAVGIAALIFHKPTRNAVGLADKNKGLDKKTIKAIAKAEKYVKNNFDPTVTKIGGGYELFEILPNGDSKRRKYMGYSLAQAKAKFKDEIIDELAEYYELN